MYRDIICRNSFLWLHNSILSFFSINALYVIQFYFFKNDFMHSIIYFYTIMIRKCVSLFLAKNYVSSYIFSNTDCWKPASLSFVWFSIIHRSSNGRNTRRGGVENDPACGWNGGPVPAQTGRRLVVLFGGVDDQGIVVVAHLDHAVVGQQVSGWLPGSVLRLLLKE